MNFFTDIREWFIIATNFLVNWALWFYGLGGIGDDLGDLCTDLSNFTARVAGYLWDAANWLDDVTEVLAKIFSWSEIKESIRGWLPGIESALAWYSNWWLEVRANINNWWSGTIATVKGWIDLATQGLSELLAAWDEFWNTTYPDFVSSFDTLKAAWDEFWTVTFPTLVSFTWLATWWNSRVADIQGLIDTAFTLRDSLWAGWQEVRDQVIEFFTDPWSWLYDRFDDFIERFW